MQRIDSIQALRALAAILVVFFHIDGAARYMAPPWMPTAPFFYFGHGGVNLFFVISGFIMVYISQRHWGESDHWAEFMARRAARVYPTYWLVYLGTFLLFYFVARMPVCYGDSPLMAVSSVLLFVNIKSLCYVPQAWTLHWEVYFYAAFSLVFFLSRRTIPLVGLAWVALSLAGALLARDQLSTWMWTWNVMNLQFLGGAAVALLLPRLQARGALPALIVGILWFAGGALANWLEWTNRVDHLARFWNFGVPSMLIVYGAVGLEQRRAIEFPRWVLLLGDASYAIYLTHLTAFTAFRAVTHSMPQTPLLHALWLAGMLIVGIGGGVAFYLVIERSQIAWSKALLDRWAQRRKAQRRSTKLAPMQEEQLAPIASR